MGIASTGKGSQAITFNAPATGTYKGSGPFYQRVIRPSCDARR